MKIINPEIINKPHRTWIKADQHLTAAAAAAALEEATKQLLVSDKIYIYSFILDFLLQKSK